jgi:uncharacterized protein YdcH (DUF465 family)
LALLGGIRSNHHSIEEQLFMSDHVFRLMERHQILDARLANARARRWVDPFEIVRLKKVKLALKDRLALILARRAATTSPAG